MIYYLALNRYSFAPQIPVFLVVSQNPFPRVKAVGKVENPFQLLPPQSRLKAS
jgi:hypothetical protein